MTIEYRFDGALVASASIALALVAGPGCVSGTPYQRALSLQGNKASDDEIMKSLEDGNWKLRCLATRACGQHPELNCSPRLIELATSDDSAEVRSCAVEGLQARCARGGSEGLATVAQHANADAVLGLGSAIARCPSADALLALAVNAPASMAIVAGNLRLPPVIPPETPERVKYLRLLIAEPEPRSNVQQQLAYLETQIATQAAEERAREEAEEKQKAAEEADRREKRAHEAQHHFEEATKLLGNGYVLDAESELTLAEANGAEVESLRAKVEKAKDRQGKGHVARAWAAARAGKMELALEERRQASSFGAHDDRLWAELDRQEARLEDARERERQRDEARREKERKKEERRLAFEEGRCPERRVTGELVGRIAKGLYEFVTIEMGVVGMRRWARPDFGQLGQIGDGFNTAPEYGEVAGRHALLLTRRTSFESTGRFELCVLNETTKREVPTKSGFTETWDVFLEDVP